MHKYVCWAAAAAFAFGSSAVLGVGTIVQTGATIEAGAAPAQGAVSIDACAPVGTPPALTDLGVHPGIGSQTLAPPSPPDFGAFGNNFLEVSDLTLPGGTYQYGTYTVALNAVITYTGPVTLQVEGFVRVFGTIQTTTPDAPITIHCEDFELMGTGSVENSVRTTGTGSDIEIFAHDDITGTNTGTSPAIRAEASAVRLGVADATQSDAVFLSEVIVDAGGGGLDVLAAGPVEFVRSGLSAAGPINILSEDQLTVSDSTSITAAADQHILLESAGRADLVDNALVQADGSGNVTIRAFGGALDIRNCSEVKNDMGGDGTLSLGCSADMTITGDSAVETTNGPIDVRCATLVLEEQSMGGGCARLLTEAGPISVITQTGIDAQGLSSISSVSGDITLRALLGPITTKELVAGTGDLDVGASSSVLLDGQVSGNAILISAGETVTFEDVVTATSSINVLAHDDVNLKANTDFTANGQIRVSSRAGDINGATAILRTDDVLGRASSSILIESHAASGRIDLDNAMIRSGTSDSQSGDVTVVVRTDTGPVALDSFIAPRSLRARLNTRKPAKSFLTIAGTLDVGTMGPLAEGPCSFDVGALSLAGTLTPKGRTFQLVTDDAKLRLVPSKSGGSRVKLAFRVKRDLSTVVTSDGQALALRFTNGAVDATAQVALAAFRFRQGRNPGALTAPDVFPVSCRAGRKGAGKDSLALKLAFAAAGTAPADAPDVTLAFGNNYSVTIPGTEFSGPKRERFSARRPDSAPAVSRATLDYRRELLTISIRGIDLGAFPTGDAVPVKITLSLGDDQRAVDVALTRRGNNLVY